MVYSELIKKSILRNINDFISGYFFENPYGYLYERDIQSHLFCMLRERVKKPVEINGYILSSIYTEYADKFDLVCLDREEIERKYNQNVSIRLNQLPNLPLLLGIEIKYVALGYQKDYLDLCRKERLSSF